MFYIGQKVVSLITGRWIQEGQVVSVTAAINCPICGEPHISTDVEHGLDIRYGFFNCTDCSSDIEQLLTKYVGGCARDFAPLESYRESFSIAMELVQEMEQVDKQKVFNPKKIEACITTPTQKQAEH